MAKLANLRPRLGELSSKLAFARDREGHSKSAEPWRAWYFLARWRHPETGLRIKVLTRDLFTCQWPGCGRLEGNTSLLVADHKTPHRGDPELFWNPKNVWTLCKSCHDSLKQAEEAATRRRPSV